MKKAIYIIVFLLMVGSVLATSSYESDSSSGGGGGGSPTIFKGASSGGESDSTTDMYIVSNFKIKLTPYTLYVDEGERAEFKLKIYDLRSPCRDVEEVPTDIPYITDTLGEGEYKTYAFFNGDLQVAAVFVEDDCTKFTVNGELSGCLGEGQSKKFSDGSTLKVIAILTNQREGITEFKITPHISVEEVVAISGAGSSSSSQSCDSKSYSLSFPNLPYKFDMGRIKTTEPGESTTADIVYYTSSPTSGQKYESYDIRIGVTSDGVTQYATAKLYINRDEPEPEPQPVIDDTPPGFPDDENNYANVMIKIARGWNLVSLPGDLIRFEGLSGGDKLIGFVYVNGKYVSMQEAKDILGSRFNSYLAENAFWIYSYSDQYLKISYMPGNKAISITPGWNLVPVRNEFHSQSLDSLARNCDISAAYFHDGEWVKIANSYRFSDRDKGKGFILKSDNYCTLTNELSPPDMPEEETTEVIIDQPVSNDVVFDTGRGSGQYDRMTYLEYYSQIEFKPYRDMHVSEVYPYVYYCNGECTYSITINQLKNDYSWAISDGSATGYDSNDVFTVKLSPDVILRAGEVYHISQNVKTTKSVGIYTAGGDDPNIQETGAYTIQAVLSRNSVDHTDRGPHAFKFFGQFE
ncbi:MAG: hypothetical protein KKG59_00035 [Nanoarchaeota archaeon]|nr:hypothetical protein [Nanoarchaeota archaeon]